jgi:hypothetical protein
MTSQCSIRPFTRLSPERKAEARIELSSISRVHPGEEPEAAGRAVLIEPRQDLVDAVVRAEMGGSVADALKRLSKDPSSGEMFDGAFDADEETPRQAGVTGYRLAMALAAYIRSLDAAFPARVPEHAR